MDSAEIVWEWHAWDHLVQDFDSTKDNFGVISDHPELIDVNHAGPFAPEDWLHTTSIDYHPDLDQILLSVPGFDEIWIIDHSTTSEEAAGHTGGNSGMGGDLICRWGNPQTYGAGSASDMKLDFQHDAHWLDIGLDSSDADYGKILILNNRIGGDYSQVGMIEPPVNGFNYTLVPGSSYGPANAAWTYTAPVPTDFYSTGQGGAQKLNNGNFLICAGMQGWTFEIDPSNNNEIVWEYINPFMDGTPGTQGDTVIPNENDLFRMNRYEPSHPAFVGRDLSPQGYIELQPNVAFCDSALSTGIEETAIGLKQGYPNPVHDLFYLEVEKPTNVDLVDLNGKILLQWELQVGINSLYLADLAAGIYILRTEGGPTHQKILKR